MLNCDGLVDVPILVKGSILVEVPIRLQLESAPNEPRTSHRSHSSRPSPALSKQPSHYSSFSPSSSTTELKRNRANIPRLNSNQMASSTIRSPTPASDQSLAVTQAPVSSSKKQKISTKESCSGEPNTMPVLPILLAQESLRKEKENDIPVDNVNGVRGKIVDIGTLSPCVTVETKTIELLEVVQLVKQPAGVTVKMSSAKCPTPSTAVDVNPSPTVFTSVSDQGRVEEFEFVDNFRIPKEYAALYKKIYEEHGHMATKAVIKSNDNILRTCVTSLLKIIVAMEAVRGAELSEALLERWEGHIKDAETLGFNIKWLCKGFNRVKNHWRSSFEIDKEVESHEQVLNSMETEYDGLCTRKEVLETALSTVKIQMSKSEAKISSEREAIQEKLIQKHNFQNEPVSHWL